MFALSSGIFGIIYKSTFKKNNDVEGYLLFLAILLSSVAFISAFIVRVVKVEGVEEPEIQSDSDDADQLDNSIDKKEQKLSDQFNQSTEDLTISGNSITNGGNIGIDEENGTSSSGSGSSSDNNKGSGDLNSSDVNMQKKGGKLKTLINNITNNNNSLDSSSYKLLNKIEDFDEVAAIGADLDVERNPNYLDGK